MDKPNENGSCPQINCNNSERGRDFDFEEFCKHMKKSLTENISDSGDVELKHYLLGYDQLYNFFLLLGGAFQFVATDVQSKIIILNKFQSAELEETKNIKNFSTVKSMVNYEIKSGMLKNSKYISGSRTLLRLHRGLDFIRKFLQEIYSLDDNEKLSGVARKTYDSTLAEYHTWIVRNTARVAMQFLPTRAELLNKISKNDKGKLNQILKMFPSALGTMNIVYDKVHQIYDIHKILDLP